MFTVEDLINEIFLCPKCKRKGSFFFTQIGRKPERWRIDCDGFKCGLYAEFDPEKTTIPKLLRFLEASWKQEKERIRRNEMEV